MAENLSRAVDDVQIEEIKMQNDSAISSLTQSDQNSKYIFGKDENSSANANTGIDDESDQGTYPLKIDEVKNCVTDDQSTSKMDMDQEVTSSSVKFSLSEPDDQDSEVMDLYLGKDHLVKSTENNSKCIDPEGTDASVESKEVNIPNLTNSTESFGQSKGSSSHSLDTELEVTNRTLSTDTIEQSDNIASKVSLSGSNGNESDDEGENSEDDESGESDDEKGDTDEGEDNVVEADEVDMEDEADIGDIDMEVTEDMKLEEASLPHLPSNSSCSTALNELHLETSEEASMDAGEKRPNDSQIGPKKKKRKVQKNKDPVKKKGKKGKKNSEGKKTKKKKNANERKNIRDILKGAELESETLAAQTAELERRKRLMELKTAPVDEDTDIGSLEEKDSELRSLLQGTITAAESEVTSEMTSPITSTSDDVILVDSEEDKSVNISTTAPKPKPPPDDDVIVLSSDEDEEFTPKSIAVGRDVIHDDSNDYEDDDLSGSQGEDEAADDPNDSGFHINDVDNSPDSEGRVLVNVKHPSEDPDIYLAPQIARVIKPHQIGGIRFLYDNLVESLSRYQSNPGFGCILAHSMGLGKTIQLIAFIDVFLRETEAKTVLCILPINTLQNWMSEFNMWLPSIDSESYRSGDRPRAHRVYLLNDSHKTMSARAKVIEDWCNYGGVLLMGYEMYRLLCSRKTAIYQKPKKPKKCAKPEIIDLEEEDKNKSLLVDIQAALVRPGPDLVVCDEGHRIKNSHAGISQSLKNIRTRRRVVLTGYPLQNNLLEYWCMVDFVRPNYLGSKTEFCNMFERPIMNGQCVDSTLKDMKIMRYRAHVLHSLLEGFVQRRGHTVLRDNLPPKQEFVFLVKLSPIQRALYKFFMEALAAGTMPNWETTNPLKAFSVCCKIWNHPDVLHKILAQKKLTAAEDDLDIDTDSKGGSDAGKPKKKKRSNNASFDDRYGEKNVISYDWAEPIMTPYTQGVLENGGKILILFDILEKTLARREKLLVFSQSLFTLNIIEEFLSKRKVPRPHMDEYWCRNRNYFRLDGGTAGTDREKLINQFNEPENDRVWLFLLSTRAGSLGINLIGANRVVVMDASWNPCHDCQAVCRVYRYGQRRNCYVYRLVSENTLEKKIYERQINKQGMSDRVVDELNPENNFSRGQVESLLHFEDKDFPAPDISKLEEDYDDDVMIETIKQHSQWITKLPFTHESLLIDKKELRLSKQEKRIAKQSYAMEKKLNVSYTRPSYSAYYPRGGGPGGRYAQRVVSPKHGRPIASVKPIMSTPVPIQSRPGNNNLAIQQLVRPGVSVHQVITTTDIVLPGASTATNARPVNRISAGQNVLVIKTTKGVYIRTGDGKIFAVRSRTDQTAIENNSTTQSITTQSMTTSTTTTNSMAGNVNPLVGMAKQVERTLQGQGEHLMGKKSDLLAKVYAQTSSVNSLLKKKMFEPNSSKAVTTIMPSKTVTSVMPLKVVTSSKSSKSVTSILPSKIVNTVQKDGNTTGAPKTLISVKPVTNETVILRKVAPGENVVRIKPISDSVGSGKSVNSESEQEKHMIALSKIQGEFSGISDDSMLDFSEGSDTRDSDMSSLMSNSQLSNTETTKFIPQQTLLAREASQPPSGSINSLFGFSSQPQHSSLPKSAMPFATTHTASANSTPPWQAMDNQVNSSIRAGTQSANFRTAVASNSSKLNISPITTDNPNGTSSVLPRKKTNSREVTPPDSLDDDSLLDMFDDDDFSSGSEDFADSLSGPTMPPVPGQTKNASSTGQFQPHGSNSSGIDNQSTIPIVNNSWPVKPFSGSISNIQPNSANGSNSESNGFNQHKHQPAPSSSVNPMNNYPLNNWSSGLQNNPNASIESQMMDSNPRASVDTDKVMRVPPQRQESDFLSQDNQDSQSSRHDLNVSTYNSSKFAPVPMYTPGTYPSMSSTMPYNNMPPSSSMIPNQPDYFGYQPLSGYPLGHGYGQYPSYHSYNPYFYPPAMGMPHPHMNLPSQGYPPFARSQPVAHQSVNMDTLSSDGVMTHSMYPPPGDLANMLPPSSSHHHRPSPTNFPVSQNNSM